MENNILGIYWWWKTIDGVKTRTYRSRGIGEKYDSLYTWLPTTSYECIHEDFPWDYWVFRNDTDHETLCQMFPDDVLYDENSEED